MLAKGSDKKLWLTFFKVANVLASLAPLLYNTKFLNLIQKI